MIKNVFRKRLIEKINESEVTHDQLHRSLTLIDLFVLGLGAIIGTGIFVITGVTAATVSGPAVIVSYLVAGLISMFIAFAYTEVASLIPTSGGAYTYAYVALGEIVAFIVGWITILYFLITAATVCTGWSAYVMEIFKIYKISLLPSEYMTIPAKGGVVNLPAIFISLMVMLLLYKGAKGSVMFSAVLVIIKLIVIAFFIVVALPYFDIKNWFPDNVSYNTSNLLSSSFMPFGIAGVMTGAAQAFFGYNGFDSIANAVEEAKNPGKNIKFAIIGSLSICIVLYMAISGLLVGLVPYNLLNVDSPLAFALSARGLNVSSTLVSLGALAGMTTVIVVNFFALSRLIFVMSRDGLLPKFLGEVQGKTKTPRKAILVIGIFLAIVSGLGSLEIVMSLSSICALTTFSMVCIILLILRIQKPKLKRLFVFPWAFVLCPIVVLVCIYMISTLLVRYGGMYFIIWMLIGIVVYFAYSRFHSTLHYKD